MITLIPHPMQRLKRGLEATGDYLSMMQRTITGHDWTLRLGPIMAIDASTDMSAGAF